MLGTYFTAILVLFNCVLVGAVIAVTQDLDFVPSALKETLDNYGNNGADDNVITEAWDGVQKDVRIKHENKWDLMGRLSMYDMRISNCSTYYH